MTVCSWCGANAKRRIDVGWYYDNDDKVCTKCYNENKDALNKERGR